VIQQQQQQQQQAAAAKLCFKLYNPKSEISHQDPRYVVLMFDQRRDPKRKDGLHDDVTDCLAVSLSASENMVSRPTRCLSCIAVKVCATCVVDIHDGGLAHARCAVKHLGSSVKRNTIGLPPTFNCVTRRINAMDEGCRDSSILN
jgi:hypothetical protein